MPALGRGCSSTSQGGTGSAGKVLLSRFMIPLELPFLSPKENQELTLASPMHSLLFSRELIGAVRV